MDNGPDSAFNSDWHFFKRDKDYADLIAQRFNSATMNPDDHRPILVYWEEDGDCFLEKEFEFVDGELVDEIYSVVDVPEYAIWTYWPEISKPKKSQWTTKEF